MMKQIKNSYMLFSIFTIVLVSLVIKIVAFKNMDFYNDSAHYANWIKDLRNSSTFFPANGLFSDINSFCYQFGIRVYNDPFRILNTISILFLYFLSFFLGAGLLSYNISSIIVNSFIVIPMIYIFKKVVVLTEFDKFLSISTVLLGIFFLLSGYLYYFSYLGIHNIGVFFYLFSIYGTLQSSGLENTFDEKRYLFLTVLLTCLAVYAHWTNLFLVPLTLVLFFVYNLKFRFSLYYAIYFMAGLLPFIVLAVYRFADIDLFQYSENDTRVASIFETLYHRAFLWFDIQIQLLSAPIFLLGLLGVILLYKRASIIPIAILVHFVMSIFIGSFTGFAHLRVFIYIAPLIILGCVYMLLYLSIRNKLLFTVVFLVLLIGLLQNINMMSSKDKIKNTDKEWGFYLDSNGAEAVAYEKASQIVNGEKVFFNTYHERDFFCANNQNPISTCSFPAIGSLHERSFSKDYLSYLQKRSIDLEKINSSYILSTTGGDDYSIKTMHDMVQQIFAQKGKIDVDIYKIATIEIIKDKKYLHILKINLILN